MRHAAYVYDRGGKKRIALIEDITSLSWGRVADDISFGDVVLSNPGPGCRQMLASIEAGRHEMVIFRDGTRVWEGPITLITYERERVSIQARDVMHYAYRLALSQPYNNAYPNVTYGTTRVMNILSTELSRRELEDPPINVVPYLTALTRPDDARTSRSTIKYQKTAFDDVDDMAANSGVDYVTVGRSIIVHDVDTMLGRTPTLTENDIVGDIIVTMYGMELATFAVVTGAEGQYGTAGGPDPYYGSIEVVDDAYDEEEGTDAPTQAELESQAVRNLSGRNPTPVEVRVPEGSRLNPNSPIALEDLVPGVLVPLRATLTARTFSQMQKLREVKVTEDQAGEQIAITLVPAPSNWHLEATRRIGPWDGGEPL